MSNLDEAQYVMFSFKLLYENKYMGLGPMKKQKKKDLTKLLALLTSFLDLKSEEYKSTELKGIIFQYLIIPINKILNLKFKLVKPTQKK